MISQEWKNIFKKEKTIFNQMVYLKKQNFSNFQEASIDLFFNPFYHAISQKIPTPSSLEFVTTSFEIFLTLLQKGILRNPSGERELAIFRLIPKLNAPLNENLWLTLSYLTNVLSKIKESLEIKFLLRLELTADFIKNINDLKNVLIILVWLCGHPEYKNSALQVFAELPTELQDRIKKELNISSVDLLTYFNNYPFGNPTLSNKNEVRYKIISGHPLFNGHFYDFPKLAQGTENPLIVSGNRVFEFYFDVFGDNLFLSDAKYEIWPKKKLSAFWETIVTKIFPVTAITSFHETDVFCVLTTNLSYSIYIFYRTQTV